MLSALGFKKTTKKEVNYLIFIDEIYLYLMKDVQYDKSKPYMRRLGNKYSLLLLQNVTFNKLEESNSYKLFIEMTHPTKKDDILQKELFFTQNTAEEFFIHLQKALTSLGIMQEENLENNNNEEGDNIENNNNNEIQNNPQEESNENKVEEKQELNQEQNNEPDIVIQEDNTKEESKKEEKKEEDKKEEADKPPEVKHKKKKKAKKKKTQSDNKEEDVKDNKPEPEESTDNN